MKGRTDSHLRASRYGRATRKPDSRKRETQYAGIIVGPRKRSR